MAQSIAISALQFIAEDPERLDRFLAMSGIEAATIRDAAREPGFMLGIIDHLLGDEPLLLAFAKASEIDPREVQAARDVLAQSADLGRAKLW